jgi:hypothetical protein
MHNAAVAVCGASVCPERAAQHRYRLPGKDTLSKQCDAKKPLLPHLPTTVPYAGT